MPGGSDINGKERPPDAESQIAPGNYAIRRPPRRRHRRRRRRHRRSGSRKQLLERPFPVLWRKIKRFRRRMESSRSRQLKFPARFNARFISMPASCRKLNRKLASRS